MTNPNMTSTLPLPAGTLLKERYLLQTVSRTTAGGIVYTALDKKLHIPAEVLEYLPKDCVLHREADTFAIQGDAHFVEKCTRLLADGDRRMHDSTSQIYDVFSANGTVYLVHILPEEQSQNEDPAATRIVSGLYPTADTEADTIELSGLPETDAADDEALPDRKFESAPVAEENELADDESMGPSVKLLFVILLVGIVLLMGCCVVFLTSLLKSTALSTDTTSLLHVPYAVLVENTDDDWLVTGRELQDSYAPGLVTSETWLDGTLAVHINGQTPTYTMPTLTGMTVSGAEKLLDRTHFNNAAGMVTGQVTVEWEVSSDVPHGMVLRQTPAAGTETRSSLVTLTVAENISSLSQKGFADADTTMPELVGQTYTSTLSGYPLLICDRMYSDKPEGEILSQYPAAGATYPANAPCYVVVSLGQAKTHMPDVQFLTLAEAEAVLYRCGLSFTVEYAYLSHVQAGLVAEQSPIAGEALAYGDTVVLTVSGDGTWQKGPSIQSAQSEVVLSVGDTCTMALGERQGTIYHTSDPAVVSVTEDGILNALSAGSAIVTASTGGQTVVMQIQVAYDKRLPYVVDGTVGEKISLSALGDAADTDTIWYMDPDLVQITEDSILTGKKAGSTLVAGERNGHISLYLVHLTKAEVEKKYVSIAKTTVADLDKMEKALKQKGLAYTIQEEYDEKAAGTVLRIQYTGYSDAKNYYFKEGSNVTLIVSQGMPAVRSIAIETLPKKTTYQVGETFVSDGLTIRVTYTNKEEEVLSKGFTVSYDFSTSGRKTVAVSYENRKTSFSVEVKNVGPVKAEITTMPTKTKYTVGEKLDTSGMEVKVTYGDGTTKTFSTGFTTKYSFGKAGTSRVTVTVEGVSTSLDVTVLERKLRSISVNALPNRTSYQVGESLDTTGMTLTLRYNDDTTETVHSGWTTKCDLTTAGKKTVTVSYGGKNTTFSITVEDAAITGIQIVTMPKKLTYTLGETLDLTGLELSVTRGSTSTAIAWPDDGITYTGSFDKEGENTITISYGGCTDTLRVSVNAPNVTMLTILTLPDKLVFEVGETLDTTGMVLLAAYENGTSERIQSGYTTTCDLTAPGIAVVSVQYRGVTAMYEVEVRTLEKRLSFSAESLTLAVGENTLLGITYDGIPGTELTYTIDAPDVVQVVNGMGGLSITGLRTGYCTITLTDGKETVTCTITVSAAKVDTTSIDATMAVGHQTSATFMPMLTFTGDGIAEREVTFTATVSYDPSRITAADYDALADGITTTSNDKDGIVFSGTVTIPKDGTIDIGYILFYGTDTTAYQWALS